MIVSKISDTPPKPSLEKALGLYNRGELDSARVLFEALVAESPYELDAHVGLGMTLWRLQEQHQAKDVIERALAIRPGYPSALRSLGIILLGLNDVPKARDAMMECVKSTPENPQAWLTLGLIEQRLENSDKAESSYLAALSLNPQYAEAMNNLATVYLDRMRYSEARELCLKSIVQNPALSEPYRTLAKVLRGLGSDHEALIVLKRAVAVVPADSHAWNDLGGLYRDMSDTPRSIQAYEKAIQCDLKHIDAKANLSCVLSTDGDYIRSKQLCTELLGVDEEAMGVRFRRALTIPAIMETSESIQETRRELSQAIDDLDHHKGIIQDPLSQVGSTNFYLAYHGCNDRELQQKTASQFIKVAPSLTYVAPHIGKKRTGGKIRLGVCSRHLSFHTIGILWAELFARLSRDDFELILFHTQPVAHQMSKNLMSRIDHEYRLPTKLSEAQRTIADQQLDILYYTDIGMEPLSYFLGYARLAPVQVVTWGHPLTTGIPTIDYFVSSKELEIKNAQSHYTEKLVALDTLNTFYLRPEADARVTRESLGINSKANLYVCPQTLFKFHPEFDSVIRGILERDPNGELLLLEGTSARHTILMQERFNRTMPDCLARIRFAKRLPHDSFLSLIKMADVMLDPIHFGGGSTTLQALAFGTPVVTLPSEFLRGRISYACYRQMGEDSLIAKDIENYCDIVTRLGTDKELQMDTRARLAERSAVLYSNQQVIVECERFLHTVFNEHGDV